MLYDWKKIIYKICLLYNYIVPTTNLRKSGLDVYGAATSLIFKTIIAVIKMQITFITVSIPDTIPLIKNSVGI